MYPAGGDTAAGMDGTGFCQPGAALPCGLWVQYIVVPFREQGNPGCRRALFWLVSIRGQLYLGGEGMKYLVVSTRVQY